MAYTRLLTLFLFIQSSLLLATEVRIGDAGAEPVSGDLSKYYPETSLWLKSGVTGGISLADQQQRIASLAIGDDVQSAIDEAHRQSRTGIIELSAGSWHITQPIQLKSGIILRGAGQSETILHYGATGAKTAIMASNVSHAGIEELAVRFADPNNLFESNPLRPGHWLNIPDWQASNEAAVLLEGCKNCYLDGMRIERAFDIPLSLRSSTNCTIRAVTITPTINRGSGAGSIIIADSAELLVTGLRTMGLRHIQLQGPLTASVFKSCVLGNGFYFRRGDQISGLLFEDCHFLLPPGLSFQPFSKGPMPLGDQSLVINCSAYNMGTDAVVPKVLMEDGVVYTLQARAHRGIYNPRTREYRRARLIDRHQITLPKSQKEPGQSQQHMISAVWQEVPVGMRVMPLSNNLLLHDFLSTGPVDNAIASTPIAELIARPLITGGTTTYSNITTTAQELPADSKKYPKEIDPAHKQAMQAKFNTIIRKPDGAHFDLLKAMNGKWKSGAVWQAVTHIKSAVTLEAKFKKVGARVGLFIGTTEIKKDAHYTLQPGWHPITVRIKMLRMPPFIKKAALSMKIVVVQEKAGENMWIDTPKPENGSLYPFTSNVDELAKDRAAITAWFDYFAHFRKAEFPSMHTDLQALITTYPDTPTALIAQTIADILQAAPADETSGPLSRSQYAELTDYYHRSGIPERKWALNKAGK